MLRRSVCPTEPADIQSLAARSKASGATPQGRRLDPDSLPLPDSPRWQTEHKNLMSAGIAQMPYIGGRYTPRQHATIFLASCQNVGTVG
jgi:hypothetical protein